MEKEDNGKKKALISIIIPIYNCEEYLEQCLESIANQTYSNIEIILIDDGSTDHSNAICKDFISRDERFFLIEQSNGGVSAARNEGLRIAKGDFIGFVDGDDYIHPDMYQRLLDACREFDVEIACCDIFYFPEIDWNRNKKNKQTTIVMNKDEAVQMSFGGKQFEGFIVNKLYKKECLRGSGNNKIEFCTDIAITEDRLFFFQALANLKKVVYIPIPLYFYRRNLKSATNAKFTKKNLTALTSYEKMLALAESRFSTETFQVIAAYYALCNVQICMRIVKSDYRDIINVQDLVNNIKKYYQYIKAISHKIPLKKRIAAKAICINDRIFFLLYKNLYR